MIEFSLEHSVERFQLFLFVWTRASYWLFVHFPYSILDKRDNFIFLIIMEIKETKVKLYFVYTNYIAFIPEKNLRILYNPYIIQINGFSYSHFMGEEVG